MRHASTDPPSIHSSAFLSFKGRMLRSVFLCVLLAACVSLSCAQQYEFCYIIQGGQSASTGGYASWSHGYFYTSSTSGSIVQITNTNITRNVINTVGQRHTEQLSAIVSSNNRVDTSLFLNPSAGNGGYLDGSGIQIPITGTVDPVNGIGTLLGYDLSQPAAIVTAYGQTSQLNANINPLYTGSSYGERLDAGGNTITGTSSSFTLQPYNPSTPITNCTVNIYQPLCVNYPATPPDGSVLFNITLNVPWTSVPAAYLGDLFAALTLTVAPTNTQAQYLGYFLFSCFPSFLSTAGPQPQVWFFLNSQSASSMGLSISTVVPTILSALQPSSTALNTAYLPPAEQGLIVSAGCPQSYVAGNIGPYLGVNGCSPVFTYSSSASPATPSTASPPLSVPSSSTAAAGSPPASTSNSSGGSSGLSHGAIAGIVIGSVVGALLLLAILVFLMRCVSSGGSTNKQATTVTQPAAANHKRFEDESSQVSTADTTTDGVEMA